jgi:hypothetical protein
MKKLLLSTLIMVISFMGYSQIETPQPSPTSKIEQKVGLTDVTLEYSRPSMRGRTVFGNLVPYGKLWRLGANANTKITFSDDVMVAGTTLKAGTYAIFAKPNEASWDIIFYSDATNWGIPQQWDDSKVMATVTAQTFSLPMDIETLTMSFDNLANGSATLGMFWEHVYVGVEFMVPTDDKVLTSINDVMNGTPTANDYYAAAVYYSQENKDIKTALKWMEKAMSMTETPAFWQLRQQSLIYAKDGNKDAAIDTAKKSLAGAEAAGNADYVKMNKDSLKEWGAM